MIISLRQRIIFSALIFIGIMLLLGIPYTNWWLNGPDDFHALYICNKTNSWKDLLYFFYDGNVGQGQLDMNYIPMTDRTPFFGTYYRPLHLIVLTLQYWIFGTHTYPYLLVNVSIHALNAVLLFNIFLSLITAFPALLATIFFAFHPQIAYRFGAIVNIQYYLNLTCILLLFIFFKKYLDTRKKKYTYAAWFFFTLSLFIREVTIVMPAIIFLGAWLYKERVLNQRGKTLILTWWQIFKETLGFSIIALLYLGLRLYLYPIAHSAAGSTFNLKNYLIAQWSSFMVFAYDFLGLSWLPWGNKPMRAAFVISLASLLIWCFIKNRQKITVLYFLLGVALLLWPAYLGPYSPRYLYEVLPFIIAAYVFCFTFQGQKNKQKKSNFQILGLSCLSAAMLFFIAFSVHSFCRRETKHAYASAAINDLIHDPVIKNKTLCFFGMPSDGLGPTCTHLIWVLLNDTSIKVRFEQATSITQLDSHIVQPTRWCNVVSNYYNDNFMTISRTEDGFTFTSLDPKKVVFPISEHNYSLGRKTVHATTKVDGIVCATSFTLHLDQQYLNNETLFIAWNYKTKRFKFV